MGRKVGAVMLAIVGVVSGSHAAVADESGTPRPTRLVPRQGSANLVPPMIGVGAALYDALNNEPLPGKRLVFTNSGGSVICTAVTNSIGGASCTGPITLGPMSVDTIYNGHFVSFSGDKHYDPATAHAPINLVVDNSLQWHRDIPQAT